MGVRPTSIDIAILAGVSQPTVSRALSGHPEVNELTRKRIEKIARDLNYRIDKNASNLRLQLTNTIAVLFFQDPAADNPQINPLFLAMLESITKASASEGYDLLISFQQFPEDSTQDFECTRKADGVILLGYGDYGNYQPRLRKLVEAGANFVRWGPILENEPVISIGSDNLQGGYEVTRHLLARGRRRMAFLGHVTHHYPEYFDRYRGYERALTEARLPALSALQVDAIATEEAGFLAAKSLMKRRIEFDAIVAASDLIAIGALRAIQASGLDVPRDVSIVGFDDMPAARLTNPPLTTVLQDTRRGGELLVETLLGKILGKPVVSSVVPTRVVVRKSG
ncbi:MAG: substrate-binding domain-containing protein [Pseudomonadota bacterium]